MDCPTDEDIALYAAGRLDVERDREVSAHVEDCEACRIALSVAQGISASGDDDPEAPPLDKGTVVGRFIVVEPVGRGAMGQVYAAFDPALDRKVALKFLNAVVPGELEDPRALRLLREARAMATVTHPNVVTVHDLGVFEGHPYVAMEFVEGTTLRGWVGARDRRADEVLEAFCAAGAGLVAAHERGLVHRDFKPDNVLVGKDGRVCVTDFGLVRWAEAADVAAEAAPSSLPTERTQTGALVGTPAYMAPEQLRGRVADARSDQYSFCIALWEALAGQRPFRGPTTAALLVAMESERPVSDRIPRHLLPTLLRGLSFDPSARFESMSELLGKLEHRRVGALKIVGLVAAVAAVGVAGVVAAGPETLDTPRLAFCEAVTDRLDEVWNAERRGAVIDALTSSTTAAPAIEAAVAKMDDYAESWTAVVQRQCTAEQQGTVPTSIAAMRMACLQRRLQDLDALAEGLTGAEEVAADRALTAAARLPSPERCATDEALAEVAGLDDPELPAEAVARLGPALSRTRTQLALGQLDDAHQNAKEAAALAETIGHRGVLAEALFELAEVQRAQGKVDEAEATLATAAEHGIAARHHRAALHALMRRAYLLGYEKRQLDRAEDLITLAQAELEALGEDTAGAADLANTRAALHLARGELVEARELYARVVQLRETEDPLDPANLARAYANLGGLQLQTGVVEEAALNLRKAEERLLEVYAPGHETVVVARSNLLSVALLRGPSDETVAYARTAVEDAVAALGEAHPRVGPLIGKLARVLQATGNLSEALEQAERAVGATTAARGAAHPHTLVEVGYFAELLRRGDQPARALEQVDHAIAALEGTDAREPMIELLQIRAITHQNLGNPERAVDDDRRAYELARELHGDDALITALTRQELGVRLLEVGRVDEGLGHARAGLSGVRAAGEQGALDEHKVGLSIARVAQWIAQHRPEDPELPDMIAAAREYLRDAPEEHLASDESAQWLARQP